MSCELLGFATLYPTYETAFGRQINLSTQRTLRTLGIAEQNL
jgi:hypothetical protein